MQANAVAVIHDYELNGNLTDALGGPSLTANGGTVGATRYSFGLNQGLSLVQSALASNSVYSFELVFEFDTFGIYRKIMDFNALATDDGFYFYPGNTLGFYNAANGATTVTTPVDVHVVLTRDASGLVNGYLNGAQQFSFSDTSGIAIFRGTEGLIRFFEDDAPTGFREASPGSVDCIRIYDGALSASAVSGLASCGAVIIPPPPNNTPEPGTLVLAALSLLGLGAGRRTRR